MLSRLAVATIATLAFVVPSFGQEVKLSKDKSTIEFVGKKTDGKHSGGFKDFSADLKVDWSTPDKSTLAIEIKTESLFSDNQGLTDHLKNPDFFDIKKHPTIKFESTKVEHTDGQAKITGKMTMLGKTEEVTIPVKVERGDTSMTLKAEFKIDRTKWGMTYGKGKINEEVEITASLVYTL